MKVEQPISNGIFRDVECPLGLGLLRLGTAGRPVDIEAINVIRFAVNQGVRILDTADVYSEGEDDLHYSEHLIRQVLRTWKGPKQDVRILTKVGMSRLGGRWIPNGRPEHIRQSVDGSLQALGVEQLFLLQLHVRDPSVNFDETLASLAELQRDGKVTHLGLCNVTPQEAAQAQQHFEVASIQNELSVVNQSNISNGSLRWTRENDIPFLASRPLGGHARADHLSHDPVMTAIAARHNATPHEAALAALRCAGSHVFPLVGATRLSSIRSSLKALQIVPDESDRTTIAVRYALAPDAKAAAGHNTTTMTSDQNPDTGPVQDADVLIVMGIQGAGKSELITSYVDAGYARLNRDVAGGRLENLIPRLKQLLAAGKQRVVLDNTYPNRESRAAVIAASKQYRVPVRCLFLKTPVAEARNNVVLRMLAKYGLPLGPEELTNFGKIDTNLPPPVAMNRWINSFEFPTVDEGFSSVHVAEFERRFNPDHTNKGLLLDVDGTLRRTLSGNVYPTHPDDVEILPGRKERLLEWVDDGYQLFFVSNQSGIAAGRVSLAAVQGAFWKTAQLLEVPITEIAYCPHPSRPDGCFCRKPMPGLGVYLAQRHSLDMRQMVMVGDMESDREFASGLGIQFVQSDLFFA